MIVLKPIVFYPDHAGCEATWVDENEVQIKCHSYHPTQVDMLMADAVALGTPLDDYQDQIAEMEAGYVPPAPPPVQVPQVITSRQAKLVLLAAGLLDDVDAAVAAADRVTQIEWEYAVEVNRNWPTLVTLAASMGISTESLDGLFIEGATL